MAYFHKNLTQEKWNNLDKDKQILNIISELMRAKNWFNKNKEYARNSLDRAFELIDLIVSSKKWTKGSLKELLRFREVLGEFYINNIIDIKKFTKLMQNFLLFNKKSAMVKL